MWHALPVIWHPKRQVALKGVGMLVYEYKLDEARVQYARIDEAIRIAQFVRNKSLRL